eukprot:gnl/MRDRNA2_/MRDRNA2_34889_c0_seq1.p1 gnl/MRDRNA2_/MRDRNA2_34889_c0~~gnl/MRDRNA2_/MRDRNA2_34889_c0_seq1.p1  ORF type:complete len:1263 (-),score=175.40 gnl/MRDRNA2_/MRDRNA2_34889_c0_seq1:61-3849(-)
MPKASGENQFVSYAVESGKEAGLDKALRTYCTAIDRFPLPFIAGYVGILAIIIGAGWKPLEVDIDIHSFMRADGEAAKLADCYEHALGQREEEDHRRLTGIARDLNEAAADEPEYAEYKLTLIYKALNGNALDDGPLRNVRELEWRMRSLPGWKVLCGQEVEAQSRMLCDPGESLTNYLWPSPYRDQSGASVSSDDPDNLFSVRFDGRGNERIPTPMVVAYLKSFPDGDITSKFLPKGFGDASLSAPVLRSHFTFRFHIGSKADSDELKAERAGAAQEKYEELVRDTLYPILSNPKPDEVDDEDFYIQVFYHGHYIQEHEVYTILTGDVLLSLGAFILVLAYAWFHTGSAFLSLLGLPIVFAAIPVAYVITPASKVSLASFLSLFVIIGIGSDFIFIFTDIWDQNEACNDVRNRLRWTIEGAGKICMAAAFTTAVSFYANIASVLRPLREFGFFMGTGVIVCFVLMVAFYPLLLLLSVRACRVCQRRSKPAVIDISSNALAVVVPTVNEQQLALSTTGASKTLSPKLSMLSRLVDFSVRRRKGMIASSCLVLLVFIITISLLSEMSAKKPEIFPEGHNQVEVKDLMEHFEPAMSSSGSWDANACTPNITGSSCMLHWCEAPGPWTTPQDQCSCIIRPVHGTTEERIASCDTVEIKSRVSGAGESALNSDIFKRQWAAHLQQAAPNAIGLGSETVPGYVFSHDGYWANPERDEGYTSSIADCAERCSLNGNCTGFNRVDIQGKCFLYGSDPGVKKFMFDKSNHAYVKIGGQVLFQDAEQGSFIQLARLVMEDWESGDIATHSFMQGPLATVRLDLEALNSSNRMVNTTCNLEELCFCGGPVCEMHGWQEAQPTLKLRSTSERLLTETVAEQVPFTGGLGRALTGSSSGEAAPSLTVTLVYGLLPSKDSAPVFGNYEDIWSFDPGFEPENPWAQRAMFTICRDVPEHLEVVDVKCWPQDFHAWLKDAGKRFPTREFHSDLLAFTSDSKKSFLKQYMWMREGRMLATKLDFNTRHTDLPGSEALALMDRWNAFVTEHNSKSSVTASLAWHTSQAWVRAEAETAIKASMVNTIVISVVCAFLGMLLFTQNLLLAMCIIVIVSCVISGLSFFMVAIMQWAIGAIEAISLVAFVGYSMTYSMHIANIFKLQAKQALSSQSADVSEVCIKAAVLQIGGAIVGSAITTLISGFFLLFCTLQVFFRQGIVVLIVTVLSVALALLMLPAWIVEVWLPGMSLFNSILRRVRKKKDAASADAKFETIVPGRPVS